MNRFLTSFFAAAVVLAAVFAAGAQQVKRSQFDVSSYLIDAQLNPIENKLTATADVTFTPAEDTRSVTFELNGSLKVDAVSRVDKVAGPAAVTPAPKGKAAAVAAATPAAKPLDITFVQDQVGVSDLGPSVRVDLGDQVLKGSTVTLRFKYSGALNTPSGGPLLNKRLAYIGPDQGYLMYAARWFPFHNYAADLATSDITLSLPAGMQMVGYSDSPVVPTANKYRFIQSKPGLVGNFAYSKYLVKNLKFGEYSLNFNTRPGFDATSSLSEKR